ncbi:retention module-containing protein [Agarivorans albus]|uniref:retention module-containing protein n=3 Tax=Agarivorans albus TaxID=182262 RepID=UPI001C7F286A|nr:retention module-containing protein [Agarivorans albus]
MEQSIATSSATIVSIQGQAFAVDAQGNIRPLQAGDTIAPGELIITSQGAQLGFYYGDDQYVLGDNSATQLPEFDPSQTLSQLNAANDLDVEALQQAILEGADPTELFEATAAGGAPAGDGSSAGNGGFVTIERIGVETIAQAGFDTQPPATSSEIADTDNEATEPLAINNSSNEPTPPAPSPDQAPTISLSVQAITEGSVDIDTVVATFSSSDPDGDEITHSLVNDPQGFFVIDGNEIKLTEAGVAAVNDDQLNLTSLNITIQAEANGLTASDSADVSIARTDDGVTPPVDQGPSISVTAETLTEESVSTDTVVANFTSSDPEGDVQTYALLNNGDGYLVLDGNQVKLTDAGVAAVNNDTLNLSELNISVEVTANGQTASDSDTAAITRVDEGPSISVAAETLTEESVSTDTVVANFTSSDPEGDAQTYALLNNGDGYLVLDGNQVKLTDAGVAAVNNDQLNLSELNVSVEVTANGKTASASDTAEVIRVNDAPTTSNVVLNPVAEDAVGGRVITEAELLANAGDIDNDLADLSVSNLSLNGNGTLTNNNDGTWTYTPAENDDGSVSFNYDISDGEATISTGTADLDITPVNDAPTTSNVVLNPVAEDAVGGRVITEAELLANAGDIDNDLADLSVSNLSLIGNGTLVNNNDGTWTYTPAEDDDGSVSFSYDISDGEATISTGTADLDITPVNDAPTTSNVVLDPVAEDAVGGRVITEAELLANAGDIDNDLADLSVSNLSLNGNGTLVNNNDGTWTYTPVEDDDGNVSFSYDISDGEATISTGTADLDITPVNDAPTTSNVVLDPVAEDAVGGRVFTEAELLANAGDIDNDLADLSVSNLSLIGNGTLTNNNDGTWTYTPAENDDGSVSFSYDISDGDATISTGTADLDITPVNDAPTTSNVVLDPVAEDAVGGRVITEAELLASAGDIDNDLADLSVSNLSLIGNGTLTNNNDGTWTYTPAENDDGSVSFSYDISDGEATISTGTADLDITPVNDAPTTSNVVLDPVAEDAVGGRVITEAELLANAGDIDNDLADLSVSNLSLIGNGTLTNNNDGTWTYTPAKDDDGSVSFSYDISDGEATISTGTADLDITPVNDAPTTSNVVLDPVAEDAVGGRVITEAELLANAGDIDNDLADLLVSNLSLIGNGSLVNNNDGTWTYTPAENDDGSVSFSYDISDGDATISTGTADLDITPVNDAPDAQDDSFANIASSETILLDLVANDSDLEGDAISVKSIHGTDLTPGVAQSISVPNGVVNVSAAGVISYTASANGSGLVEFSYVLQDEHGAESSADVSGNVVNLSNDSAQVYESGLASGSAPSAETSSATGNLLANDDGLVDGLELSSVEYQGVPHTADANGVITIDTAQGQLSVYTQDYNGFSKGDYEYQLESSSLAGDGVSESFNYLVANPASGFVTQANLEISIEDDAPVGHDLSHSLESSPLLVTTNLVLVLDTSASMTNGEHGDGLNYLEIAVKALSNLIEQADAAGNVNVQIVGFSDSVISSGWISDNVEDALSYLQDLSSGGGTHYDIALNEVISSSTSAQQPDADNTLLYFISDGEPNFGYGIDDTVEYNGSNGLAAWDEFVQDNIDTSYGIGIGQADLDVLKDVASESATDEFAFIVDDVTDLSSTLVESYLEAEVDASLGLLQTASTDGFMVGADDGYVSAITVDDVTYSYDPSAVPEQEKNVSITTALGGVLLLNFVTGAYSYELDVGGDGWGQQENIAVTVTDFDGDTSSINIEINTVFEAVVDANRDVIITNQDGSSTISVPSLALLWNDTGDDISFDGVGNAVGGSVSGSDEILFDSDDGVGLGIHDSNFETEELSIIATAEDVSFVDFNGHDAVDLSDRSLFSLNDGNIPQIVSGGYSFTYQSELVNDNDPVTNADEDWIKVTLAEGEVLWANMATISGQERVKVDAFIYDAEGNLLVTDNGTTKFQEDWQGPRGSFTATEEGEYYIQIVADDDTDSGFYQMHLTIDASSAVYQKSALTDTQEEFEYSIIGDGGALDTTTAELIGVQGSSIDGGEGDEVLVGNEAANVIDGDAGDDALVGYAGDDQLDGGVGEDLLIGGQGNDILTGGDDSDMFAWLEGDDQGSSNDTITDFTLKDDSDPDNSPDVLDLSDLLQGETEASLESYLSFETVNNGGNVETIISIDKDGASNGESVHQTITLKDVDFSGMSDSEILSQLIEDQQLNVDN